VVAVGRVLGKVRAVVQRERRAVGDERGGGDLVRVGVRLGVGVGVRVGLGVG